MIFSTWIFLPPGRFRNIILAMVLMLAGEKALLLLPIWLLGVALQRSRRLGELGSALSVVLCLAGFLTMIWLSGQYDHAKDGAVSAFGPWVARQLAEAKTFWLDWAMGIAVMVHLAGARVLFRRIPFEWIERPVRWCAGLSFAAYLFHMPLFTLCAAFLPKGDGYLSFTITLGVIATLGPWAERSKRAWRRGLEQLLNLVLLRTKLLMP